MYTHGGCPSVEGGRGREKSHPVGSIRKDLLKERDAGLWAKFEDGELS